MASHIILLLCANLISGGIAFIRRKHSYLVENAAQSVAMVNNAGRIQGHQKCFSLWSSPHFATHF